MNVFMKTFSLYYMIALVFQSKSAGSTVDFTPASLRHDISTIEAQIKQAGTLRDTGKSYLSTKQYSKAALCYAAVLQVMEGVGGSASGELRQRCGLTLAECEIKTGNLYAAIARCSEVIEECPEVLSFSSNITDTLSEEKKENSSHKEMSELGKLRQVLGQAFYRRGVALSRLDEPKLALLDLQEALKKIPDDLKILQHIETSESIIMNNYGLNDENELVLESELQEQLQCIVEDAQANYQRAVFSKKQIYDLLHKKQKSQQRPAESGFSGLGDLFGGGNPSSSSMGLPGLGDIGSLLGNNSGSGSGSGIGSGIKGLLGNLGMLLRMFTGYDKETITNIEEMVKACTEVFEIFKNAFKSMMKHKMHIIVCLSFVWVISTFLPSFI